MIVFVNSSVLFHHKPARYGGNSMLYNKGKTRVVCSLVS